ncbi:MAG: hypothetical protein H0X38_01660 [Planctomycetes bacterium]|nr:hypothetical protein [Planctomycetota bacterium]
MTARALAFALAVALLAAGGWFLYLHRHHFSPRGVVRCALGTASPEEIADLFARAPAAVRGQFDFKNCIANHGALPSHGYRTMTLTSRAPDTRDVADYARPGFVPEAMVVAVLYDPFTRTAGTVRYPCLRVGGWWYIMDTWAAHAQAAPP